MPRSLLRLVVCSLVLALPSLALAAAPTTTTNPATGITTSSAILNGAGDPNGEATTGWFRLSANNPVTCDDAFGTRVPATSGTDLGTGTVAVPYSITTTGLTPGVTYYFCSIVANASGTAFGAVLSFTIPAAPIVLTTGATGVSSSGATLQGSANPVASLTTGWFRYHTVDPGTCNDSFGTRAPSTGGTNLGTGTGSVDYNRTVAGLLPGTTYYYCAIASNTFGTSFGGVLFFTTPPTAPTITTNAATGVTTSTGTLNATGIARGDTAIGWFRYSTTNPGTCNDSFGTRLPAAGGTALGAANDSVVFSQPLTGLPIATTYYYCAIGSNTIGTTFGGVVSFTTSATPPTVTTNPATLVAGFSATINASANPNGASTTGWFRFSTTNPGTCNDSFGARVPTSSASDSLLGMGTTAVNYARGISGLTPTTTYYFCALANNALGTSFGAVLSFTTPAVVPAVTTVSAVATSGTAATLNGSANPNGDATTGWFRYATASPGTCNDSFGTRLPAAGGAALGGGTAVVAYAQGATGLTPLTTYFYCAVAQNALGTSFGAVLSFTTPAAPTVTTSPPSSIANTSVMLNGLANPNRATTTGWFRYSATDPGTCDDSFGSRAPVAGGSNLGAGSSSQGWSQPVSSLSPGQTYYYCAIASNSEGIALGAVLSFTTHAVPTVTTTAATLVTATTARVNGAADPNGAAALGWFRYSTVNPGACNDSFGTRAPITAGTGTSLGSGTSDVPYFQALASLTPNTVYYVCAIASNTYGTSFGAVLTFTTLPAAPVVVTSTPTMSTGATALLGGSANPGGDATTGWFRYSTVSPGTCNDSFGTRAPASGGTAVGAGTAAIPYTQGIAGLSPLTTYFVCAIAQNSIGTSFGALVTFTTPAPPDVTTQPATNLTNTAAQLNALVNPNRATTTGWFRYATTHPGSCNDSFGSRAPISGGSNAGAGSTTTSYLQSIAGLSAGTTYYFCAIAQNAEGLSLGAVLSFTTLAAPTVTTNAATLVTSTSARVNGTANPNGATALGWFRYSATNPGTCNDTFGTRVPITAGTGTNLGAGTVDATYFQALAGLTPATVYYFCAIASNTYGTSVGAVLTFNTGALPPTVTTSTPTLATSTTAQWNGTANPNGDATTAWFRYSTVSPGTCNDSFGTRAPASGGTNVGAGTAGVAYNQPVTGLTAATTYFICAIAQNALGTTLGNLITFTTPAPPAVTTSAVTSLTNTTVTLAGLGNPNRATTTGWFRYSTTNPGACSDSFGSRAPASGGSNLGAGSTDQSYGQPVSGLSAGTTYYYCAIAQNAEGIAFGLVLSFTTHAVPTVTTTAATLVAATTARVNGSAIPNGAATLGWLRYSTTSPGTCNDSFGTRAPITAGTGTSLGAGAVDVPYFQSLTGLTPATTYFVCAIANNTYGTGFGAVQSFTTLALPPAVTTSTPAPFTGTTAQLNGNVNPNGDATTAWFRYSTVSPGTCNDSFGVRAPAAGGSSVGGGTTGVAYNQGIVGLTQATTYFVCAIAQNALGTSFGGVITFTTAAPPTVTTSAATVITSTTATLNGNANPNRAATTGYYRYSTVNPGTCDDSFGTRAPVSGGTSLGAGSSAQAYAIGAVGLTPATTYYFCAIAANAEGTGFGTVLQFTTLATPTVVTNPATLVTSTSATLHGTGNPNLSASLGWFRYSTVNPGTCNDSFGARAPVTAGTGTNLGAGTTPVAFSQPITGLLPGATYYYCAIASNSVGAGFGAVLNFTAIAGTPSVTTNVPTGVTTTTATLNGAANPNGASTTAWFRIATTNPVTCDDVFGIRVPGVAGSALGAGNGAVTYSEALTTLAPGTTYYYCAIAGNAAGTGFGIVRTFATPQPPTVATLAATPVTATTATINALGNPNGFATTGWFRHSATDPGTCNDAFGTRMPATGGVGLGAGTAAVAFSQPLTALSPGTTYYFCALAVSSIGTTLGEVLSFTTPPVQPSVTTLAASGIDTTAATLEGSANPNGDPTTAWFRYATAHPGTCSDSFGVRAPASGGTGLGAGNLAVAFSQPLAGLALATTYYYCAIASNGIGTSFGAVVTFTTASAPTVTTTAATAVTSTTATLGGSANPNFGASTGWFRYATTNPGTCDDSFGTRAPASGGTNLGAGGAAVVYTQPLAGLAPGTTYYFCAIASNVVGTRFGAVLSFATTSVPTVTTDAATAITTTGATLNGQANPNGVAATGWYRYATTNPGTCSDSFGTRAPASGGTALGAGTAAVAFPRPITGLVAATTYYYCAIASSAVGTGFGAVASFTTAGPPTVTTDPATAVTTTGATLHGQANPNLVAATGWFRYSTVSPGTCNDSFGTRAPATGGTALGAGAAAVPYAQVLTTLAPGTTYFFCAIASSTAGTRFGAVRSFVTPAAPTVTTSAATLVTSTSATLNGSANPNGNATTGWFRYATTSPGTCNDSFGTRAPATGGTDLGAGAGAVPYVEPLTGLVPGTTYFVCAIASSAIGTGVGAVQSFTTPAAPTVTTTTASAVASTTATLNGSANPRLSATTGWFRYSTVDPGTCDDSFGTRAPALGGADLGAGATAVAYLQALTGLTTGTSYYYCAIAGNAVGTSFGTVLTFTTTAAPSVTTDAATAITTTTATLNGTANPNGTTATGWFRYATTDPGTCSDTFGTRAPATGGTALGTGTAPVVYTRGVTALTPGTTYYYCAIASNPVGTGFGAVMTFNTAGPPTVTTDAATAVSATGATLNGQANPNLTATTGWFRYASTSPGTCNDVFGTRAPTAGGTALGAGAAAVPYAQAVTGLVPGATYHYCAIANSTAGTRFGAVLTFTTPAAPTVTTTAPSAVTASGATLNGTANPNATAAIGWFRYDTTDPGTCNDSFGARLPASGGTALGSGTVAVPYSEPVTGLAASTTYYYCAIASNPTGTGVGAVLSFTTPDAPAVTTVAATMVGSTGATLQGTANPRLSATTGWFRYATVDPGTCDDSFGTRAPATGGAPLGAGAAAVPYLQAVTALAPATTYYYCAIAQNAVGTRFGAVLAFTTTAAPTVTTEPPTGLAGTAATLEGTANPNLAATTGWFRYATVDPGTCDDSFGTRAPATGGTDLGAGAVVAPYDEDVIGLVPATTYYYCAIAQNPIGTRFGAVVAFTTPAAAPSVTTDAPTDVVADGAVLNGSAVPNGGAATGWFRYATVDPGTCDDTFGTRAPATGGTDLGAGATAVAYAETVSGLTAGTTYYYCAIAGNAAGIAFGAVATFAPGSVPPTVTTEAATGVTATAAMLAGTANPNGTDATGWFRYGDADPGTCDDAFGMRAPAAGGVALGAGTVAAPFGEPLTALLPHFTYYYCAAASNLGGATFGEVLSFTTARVPPTVRTVAATPNGDAIVLDGAGNPMGSDTIGWFQYDTTDPGTCDNTFGTRTATVDDAALGAGRDEVAFSHVLTGLAPGTYFACALASSVAGEVYGEVVTFAVGEPPIDNEDKGCCHIGPSGPLPPLGTVFPVGLVLALLLRRRRARRA